MEDKISEKIKYLNKMLDKFEELNKVVNDKYRYRSLAICEELEVLEQLRDNKTNNSWDEAYEEDLKESKQ